MQTCPKCHFVYYPEAVPGGQCPRCLLTTLADDDLMSGTGLAPMTRGDLADEELMAELPDFDIIECLGRGGMGVVWKARERVLDRHVAVKLLLNPEKDQAFVERFTREARIMARLNHPNIVTLYSFGRTRSGHCYLVMELVEGTNLAKLMEKSRLTLPLTLQVVTEVCAALQHAHEAGYVHRDIKPANVLLDRKGRVKVADFGLARLTQVDPTTLHLTKMGFAVGTPHYMAPEQEHGRSEVDHRADIYSLGVMFYQMLTGDLPRGVFSPPSQKSNGDGRLDKLVLRALNNLPENRYQRVADVVAELQPIREAADPVLRAERDAQRKARAHRSRLEMTFAGLAALFVGIISAWYVRGWMDMPPILMERAGGTRRVVVASSLGIKVADASGLVAMPGSKVRVAHVVRLQPPALQANADFGRSISMHGPWLMVGASRDGKHGSVFWYKRDPNLGWKLLQRIDNPVKANGGAFGYAVALGESHLVVGAPAFAKQNKPGTLWLYKLMSTGQWVTDSGLPVEENRTSTFGHQVAISGGTVAATDARTPPRGALELMTLSATDDNGWASTTITSPGADIVSGSFLLNAGEAFVPLANNSQAGGTGSLLHCVRDKNNQWQQTVIEQPEKGAYLAQAFGTVAAEGDVLVAGAARMEGGKGGAWVLHRDEAGQYRHEVYLAPPPDFGTGELGKSVAVHGEWIAAGADHAEVDANHRGGVVLFHRGIADNAANWNVAFQVKADPAMNASDFGQCVTLDDNCMVVGAPQTLDDAGQMTGAVFVYEWAEPLR